MQSSQDLIRSEIEQAEPILKALDARLQAIQFDPLVSTSVQAANAEVGQAIEDLLAPFMSNPILGPLALDLKDQYLDSIHSQVIEAKAQASRPLQWQAAV